MSDYANKLSSLAEKKQKILQEETKLIERRKIEIGHLAEKFDLLTVSDTLIAGSFSEIQSAIKSKSEKLKTWENAGVQLLKPKRHGQGTQESKK